jgi:Protein of unknown function (DUF3298)
MVRLLVCVCGMLLITAQGCKKATPPVADADRTGISVPGYDTLSYQQRDTTGTYFQARWVKFGDSTAGCALLDRYVLDFLLKEGDNKHATLAAYAADFMAAHATARKASNYTEPPWSLDKSVVCLWLVQEANLVSLEMAVGVSAGGAHPNSTVLLKTHRLDTGKPMQLTDFFEPGFETQLRKLGEAAFREARQLPTGKPLSEAEFQFAGDRFALNDNWALVPLGIRFHFDTYEVAPFVLGPTDYTIPYSQLRPLLKTEWINALADKPL